MDSGRYGRAGFVMAAFFLLSAWVGVCNAADAATKSGGSYIPSGEEDRGRLAFIQLNCMACHAVKGDEDLKKSWSTNQGPLLRDDQNKRGRGYLLDSILLPSHQIAGENLPPWATSVMGSFYPHAMSVQQLLDIATYLDAEPEAER